MPLKKVVSGKSGNLGNPTKVVYGIIIITWWLIPLSEFCPSYKWINPTYPTYNWDITHFTKWDELASMYEFSF